MQTKPSVDENPLTNAVSYFQNIQPKKFRAIPEMEIVLSTWLAELRVVSEQIQINAVRVADIEVSLQSFYNNRYDSYYPSIVKEFVNVSKNIYFAGVKQKEIAVHFETIKKLLEFTDSLVNERRELQETINNLQLRLQELEREIIEYKEAIQNAPKVDAELVAWSPEEIRNTRSYKKAYATTEKAKQRGKDLKFVWLSGVRDYGKTIMDLVIKDLGLASIDVPPTRYDTTENRMRAEANLKEESVEVTKEDEEVGQED